MTREGFVERSRCSCLTDRLDFDRGFPLGKLFKVIGGWTIWLKKTAASRKLRALEVMRQNILIREREHGDSEQNRAFPR